MDSKLVKMGDSCKDLIDQENSKDSHQNENDDHDPLVIDLAKDLKPLLGSQLEKPLLGSYNSETDSCDSEEREMNNRTNNLKQIMGEQSVGSNMKQLKNYVNFYKMTRDFEQKFKSLKSKNKSKLYFSMSSLSEVKKAINNPQKEMVGKIHCMKKWKSESNLNTCNDIKFTLKDFQHRLVSEKNLEEVNSWEFISEPLLSSATNENDDISQDLEKDPLSIEEDIKPTLSDLIDMTHPKESPKKGLIKLRNITELVDNESNNKKTKSLNIPVKFDLKNMRIVGHTSASASVMPASTSVSSISKAYLCYSDIKESFCDNFNPIIESSYSLAPKVLNTTNQNEVNMIAQKLNIPIKEIDDVHNKEIDSIHEINTYLPSLENVCPISNQITTNDPAHFSLISLNAKSEDKTGQKHYFLKKSFVPLKKSPNKNNPSLLPASSVSNTKKASFINVNDKGLPSFINVISDSQVQKIGVVYPKTQEPKLLHKKSSSAHIAKLSVTGTIQNTPVVLIPKNYNQTSPKITSPKAHNSLTFNNPSTYSNKKKSTAQTPSPNETIIGNMKLVKPVSITSNNGIDRENTLSNDILPNNIPSTNSLVNANLEASILNLKKSPNMTSSSTMPSLLIPKPKVVSKTLSSLNLKNRSILTKQTALQDKNSEQKNKLLPNLSPFNEKSDQVNTKQEPSQVLMSNNSTVVLTNNQKDETQTGFPTRQSVRLVPTSKPVVPSNSTIAKTRLLFRKDIPKKEGRKSARRHTCKWCEASFIKEYLLDQHIHRVTCNMVYECVSCYGRRILFRNRCQLLKHLVTHYGSNNNIVINYNKLKIFRLSIKNIFSLTIGKEDVTESLPIMKSDCHISSSMKQKANPTNKMTGPHITLNQWYKNFQVQKIVNDARKKANLQISLKSDSKATGHKLNNLKFIPVLKKTNTRLKVPVKKSSKPVPNTNAVQKVNSPEKKQAGLEWTQNQSTTDIVSKNSSPREKEAICQQVMVEERMNEEKVQSKSTLKDKEDICFKMSNIEKDKIVGRVPTNLGNQLDLNKSNKNKTLKSIDIRMKHIDLKRKLPEESMSSDRNSPKKNKMNDSDTDSISSNEDSRSTENYNFCSANQNTFQTKENLKSKLNTTEDTSIKLTLKQNTTEDTAVEKEDIIEKPAHALDVSSKEENNIISCQTEGPSSLIPPPLPHLPLNKYQSLCCVCKEQPKSVCFNVKNRPNPKFTCTTYCQAIMSNACTLELHKNLHERKKPFICPSCGQEFTMYKKLSTHMTTICKYSCRTIVSKCIFCDYCVGYPPNAMDDSDSMEKHFVKEHLELLPESVIGDDLYQCQVCFKQRKKNLSVRDSHLHFKFHFGNAKNLAYRYKCDGCNELFASRNMLLSHSCL